MAIVVSIILESEVPPAESLPARPLFAEPSHGTPLAGDLLAMFAARIGADRAAKWIANKLGVDCHCPERQQAFNRIHQKIRTYLSRTK